MPLPPQDCKNAPSLKSADTTKWNAVAPRLKRKGFLLTEWHIIDICRIVQMDPFELKNTVTVTESFGFIWQSDYLHPLPHEDECVGFKRPELMMTNHFFCLLKWWKTTNPHFHPTLAQNLESIEHKFSSMHINIVRYTVLSIMYICCILIITGIDCAASSGSDSSCWSCDNSSSVQLK